MCGIYQIGSDLSLRFITEAQCAQIWKQRRADAKARLYHWKAQMRNDLLYRLFGEGFFDFWSQFVARGGYLNKDGSVTDLGIMGLYRCKEHVLTYY